MLAANRTQIEQLARRLAGMRSVCCLTGAGISAESGVPTFRGADGLWRGHRAEQVATPEAFARDSALVWAFYNERRQRLLKVKPNPAHFACARLQRYFEHFDLITQNVDGLHQLAGCADVIELHGNIWTVRCTECARQMHGRCVLDGDPVCTDCGALLRPGVVWFGEPLPTSALQRAQQALARCQAMLVVGTSSVVQPAASMAGWAQQQGAFVVEVNIGNTPQSDTADARLVGPAGVIFPQLVEALESTQPNRGRQH